MSFWPFKRKPVRVGDKAPDFTLPSQTGESVRLSDRFRQRWVVLYFYPKDDTYNCIAESCDFRDRYVTFRDADAEIIGVSSDSPTSHARFVEKYHLPFILLSDEENRVRRLYGVPSTLGIVPGRVTYVIDKTGIIRHLFSSQFQPHSHVEEALHALRELQSSDLSSLPLTSGGKP